MRPSNTGLDRLLSQLDSWRHFAAYKLEQRVDVLFGLFLPEILGGAPFGSAIERRVVPEFPFPQERLLGTESPSFRSDRIDFVAISQDRRKLYLVELKTDHASLRDEQLGKMLAACDRAREGTALAWVSTLVEVAKPSRSRHARKYLHLLSVLEEWGLVGPLAAAHERAWSTARQGLTAAIESANPVHHPDCRARLEAIELVPVLVCPEHPPQTCCRAASTCCRSSRLHRAWKRRQTRMRWRLPTT